VSWMKKGPELKMPDLRNLKVPPFLSDVYWDLRDRHLLPVVALVIVAIVAAPFLLGGSKHEPSASTPFPAGAPSPEPIAGASASRLTVVQAEPGLRDYRKRLLDDSPTNPFKQKFTSPMLKGTKLGNGKESATLPVTTTTGGSEGGSSQGGGGGGSGGAAGGPPKTLPGGGPVPKPGELISYAWAIDVQVTKTATKDGGGKETTGPTTHKRVLPYAGIPSTKVPVVVYMGPDPTTHKPMLLVSDGVASTFGEAKCLSGDETCQLLEVETGMPVTFSYGPNLDRYKINVLKIYRVATSRTQVERSLSQMSQNFSK
jgi:hypothetical protein